MVISNHRLVRLEDGKVTFRWRDYKDGNKQKLMTLDAMEFIRRFLIHVLPRGFVRIRHFGFLANSRREQNLLLCRQLLGVAQIDAVESSAEDGEQCYERFTGESMNLCPVCRQGHMVFVESIEPIYQYRPLPARMDSS